MCDHAASVCFEPAEDEAAVRRVLAGAGCLEGLAEVHLLQGHARLRYETEGQALQAAALLPWDAAAAAGTMPAVPGVPKGAVPSFLQKMQQAANAYVAAVNRQNTARAPPPRCLPWAEAEGRMAAYRDLASKISAYNTHTQAAEAPEEGGGAAAAAFAVSFAPSQRCRPVDPAELLDRLALPPSTPITVPSAFSAPVAQVDSSGPLATPITVPSTVSAAAAQVDPRDRATPGAQPSPGNLQPAPPPPAAGESAQPDTPSGGGKAAGGGSGSNTTARAAMHINDAGIGPATCALTALAAGKAGAGGDSAQQTAIHTTNDAGTDAATCAPIAPAAGKAGAGSDSAPQTAVHTTNDAGTDTATCAPIAPAAGKAGTGNDPSTKPHHAGAQPHSGSTAMPTHDMGINPGDRVRITLPSHEAATAAVQQLRELGFRDVSFARANSRKRKPEAAGGDAARQAAKRHVSPSRGARRRKLADGSWEKCTQAERAEAQAGSGGGGGKQGKGARKGGKGGKRGGKGKSSVPRQRGGIDDQLAAQLGL
ncbi:hypothetical protein DIPPA_10887 [Diplonema papillatum]|nr:hypothetical protein DIPPA_10887 [Diplonema papillatum]